MTTIRTFKLARDTYVVGIHGVTGQPYSVGQVGAGTLVRNVRHVGDACFVTDEPRVRFEASADGGKSWFLNETFGELGLASSAATANE